MNEIRFTATVAQVRTLADGGLRFVLDAGESESMVAAELIECKRFGAVLDVTIEPRAQEQLQAENGKHKPVSRRAAKKRVK